MKPMETERIQLLDRRESPGLSLQSSSSSSPQLQRKSVINAITSSSSSSNVVIEEDLTRDSNNNYRFVFYDLSRAGLLGVVTGASVAVFKLCIESLRNLSYNLPLHSSWKHAHLVIPFIPALGGLVVGLLTSCVSFPPGLRGTIQETDRDSKAKFFGDECNKQFSALAFFLKTIAAICTLGTGNSLGPEGPSVEIGVNLSRVISMVMNDIPASNVSEIFKHNRLLLSCGGAAGVAAGFNAPISGIFFALEVIQGTFVSIEQKKKDDDNDISTSTDAENLISTKGGISSIVLSAVVAALVSKSILGDELVFKVAKYSLKAPLLELPLYLFLGSVCGLLAFIFSLLTAYCKKFFDGEFGPAVIRKCMSSTPAWLKPVIGGLFCGIVGRFYPQILFFGYETLNNLLTKTTLTFELLLKLLAVKMIATVVASGSGLVGGLFAPTLFFGGMLGALFHNIFAFLLVRIGRNLAELPAYAMIGSASFLAAVFRAPLTGSLILFECTREYDVILPLMASAGWASVVADVLDIWKSTDRKPREEEYVLADNTSDEEKAKPASLIRTHDEQLDTSMRSYDESDKLVSMSDNSETSKRRLSDDSEITKRKVDHTMEEIGR